MTSGPAALDGTLRESLTSRIRARGPSLSRTGSAIAAVLLDDPSAVMSMTVSDLAAQSGTSVGSVVRFCQDLGLKGYQDLKIQIAAERLRPARPFAGHADGSPAALLVAVLQSSARAITDAIEGINVEEFAAAAAALGSAGSVLLVAVGTSAPLAQDAAYRLKSIGLRAEAPADALTQHIAAGLLQRGDACLSVSHTGQTRETLAAVTAARQAGATTIAITSFARSPLTELSDHTLVAGSAETAYRVEAMTSRFPHLALLDALHNAVASAQPDRAERASHAVAEAISEHRL